jgi:hypothetical protein
VGHVFKQKQLQLWLHNLNVTSKVIISDRFTKEKNHYWLTQINSCGMIRSFRSTRYTSAVVTSLVLCCEVPVKGRSCPSELRFCTIRKTQMIHYEFEWDISFTVYIYIYISWRNRIFRDLERGPLRLVSTTKELLGRKSSGSGLESREHGRRNPSR